MTCPLDAVPGDPVDSDNDWYEDETISETTSEEAA